MNAGRRDDRGTLLARVHAAAGPFSRRWATSRGVRRGHASNVPQLNEMAIVGTGPHKFEWAARTPRRSGSPRSRRDCRGNPPSMAKEVVYNRHRAPEHHANERRDVQRDEAMFGERGIVDLVGVMGGYTRCRAAERRSVPAARRTKRAQAAQIGFGLRASAGKVAQLRSDRARSRRRGRLVVQCRG